MPRFEVLDRRALARAVRAFTPMLRRRGWTLSPTPRMMEAEVREAIQLLLEGIEADDPVRLELGGPWARVEASGLVLVGVERSAVIVGRVVARGGRARKLLVP